MFTQVWVGDFHLYQSMTAGYISQHCTQVKYKNLKLVLKAQDCLMLLVMWHNGFNTQSALW